VLFAVGDLKIAKLSEQAPFSVCGTLRPSFNCSLCVTLIIITLDKSFFIDQICLGVVLLAEKKGKRGAVRELEHGSLK